MMGRNVLSDVKNKLARIHFMYDDLFVSKIKDEYCFLDCYVGNKQYMIKYFYNLDDYKKEIYVNKLLKDKVAFRKIIDLDERVIIYDNNDRYEAIKREDFKYESIIKEIAIYFKQIHNSKGLNCFDYNSLFSYDNLKYVMKSLNMEDNVYLNYIKNNFQNINLKLHRLHYGLIYGDFSLEKILISKDKKSIVMEVPNRLILGYTYKDINDFLDYYENKELFLKKFDYYKRDDEVIHMVVDSVIKLYLVANKEIKIDSVSDIVQKINNGELLEYAKNVVEWF